MLEVGTEQREDRKQREQKVLDSHPCPPLTLTCQVGGLAQATCPLGGPAFSSKANPHRNSLCFLKMLLLFIPSHAQSTAKWFHCSLGADEYPTAQQPAAGLST
jgi:hypothetical protein